MSFSVSSNQTKKLFKAPLNCSCPSCLTTIIIYINDRLNQNSSYSQKSGKQIQFDIYREISTALPENIVLLLKYDSEFQQSFNLNYSNNFMDFSNFVERELRSYEMMDFGYVLETYLKDYTVDGKVPKCISNTKADPKGRSARR